jgi:hypothetical protein
MLETHQKLSSAEGMMKGPAPSLGAVVETDAGVGAFCLKSAMTVEYSTHIELCLQLKESLKATRWI